MAARVSWITSCEVLIDFCQSIKTRPTTIKIHTYPCGVVCPYLWGILAIGTYPCSVACRYPWNILSSFFDWQTPRTFSFFKNIRAIQRISRLFRSFVTSLKTTTVQYCFLDSLFCGLKVSLGVCQRLTSELFYYHFPSLTILWVSVDYVSISRSVSNFIGLSFIFLLFLVNIAAVQNRGPKI